MRKPLWALLVLPFILTMLLLPQLANAASDGIENMGKAEPLISQAINMAKEDI